MTIIALLRGINVGGHKLVAMSDLVAMLENLGLAAPRSLLQSGNLVFGSETPCADLERRLEAETEKRFGHRIAFLLRTAAEWQKVVTSNPYADMAAQDPGHLVVVFLKSAPSAPDVEALRKAIKGPELVETDDRQAYVVYPDGIGRSKLTLDLIEKRLGTIGTGRNWNTVQKVAALVADR